MEIMSELLPHLKYTSGAYLQDTDDRGIYPLAENDCHIIMSWLAILENAGLSREAVMMSRWKQEEDEDHLLNLRLFMETNEIPDIDSQKEKSQQEIDFEDIFGNMGDIRIDFGGHILELRYIFRIDKHEGWGDGSEKFSIIINKSPLPAKYAWYEDTVIDFYNKEERDEEYNELKKKLVENGVKFI